MEKSPNKITNEQIDKLIIESNHPMNSLGIQIPYSYFSGLVKLNWYDVLFAIENIYLPLESVIKHAEKEIDENPNYHESVFDLAILSPNEADTVYEINKSLAELTKQVADEDKLEARDKVLYVLLKWIFEHQESYVDPLKVVEIIYDDFNYPEVIKNFVRYEPSPQTILGKIDSNIERLYNNWRSYLEVQEKKYSTL